MTSRRELSHMERFVNNIDVNDTDCWEWQGETIKGYGRYRIAATRMMAHRFSYTVYKGDVPDGLYIDHLCRNTRCVNPDHLEAVTAKENQERSTWREAMIRIRGKYKKEFCKNGHSMTDPANLYTTKSGHRTCKICAKRRSKQWQSLHRKSRSKNI